MKFKELEKALSAQPVFTAPGHWLHSNQYRVKGCAPDGRPIRELGDVGEATSRNIQVDARRAELCRRFVDGIQPLRTGRDFRTAQPYAILQMAGRTVSVWPRDISRLGEDGLQAQLESLLPGRHGDVEVLLRALLERFAPRRPYTFSY